MPYSTPPKKPVAIKIDGCEDVHIEGNVAIGVDLLEATQSKRIKAINNTTINPQTKPEVRKAPQAKTWILSVVGSVIAAGIVKSLGWV